MKLSVSAYRASYNLSEQRILAGPVPTYGSTTAPGHEGSSNVVPVPAASNLEAAPEGGTLLLPQLQLEGEDMAETSLPASPIQTVPASTSSEIILNPTTAAAQSQPPAEIRLPTVPATRTRSNQRWMKLRTTVQLTGAIASSVQSKKSSLKREDSFIARFSTRQVPEVQETFDTGDEADGLDRPKKKTRRKKRGTVINPDGNFLFYWLFVLTSCVLYNLWTVIVRQAFPELYTSAPVFWLCTDGFSDMVFLLDVLVQFRTGYLEQGLIVSESRKLAVHYVKSQAFLLDVFSLIPIDWLLPYDLRWRPLLRFVRFTKVYRMYHYYYMVESRTIFPNMWRVLNLVHILLLLAHWFGCFYYLLSEAEGFRSDWSYPVPEGDFSTLTRKYLGSLYWSTLTLTTIGDLPTPETNAEKTRRVIAGTPGLRNTTATGPRALPRRGFKSRLLHHATNTGYVFTIASYLIGVFIFATIVGQVGNVITNRNASRLEFERLLDSAKLYMRHHKVPRSMQRRVQRWYDYSWSRGRIQGGGDINSALRILPDKLKTELALHVNLLTLKKVSIFQECQPEFLHDLVLKMKASIFTPGDMICRRGEVAREMFIIADGILEVISEHGKVLTTMKAGDFFGEIGILNLDGYNKRTADVRSVGFSELFSLSREDVLAAMKDYPEAQDILQTLGRKRLMEARKAASQYRANQIAARKAKNRGAGEGSEEAGTGRRFADRLRSDVKGIRQALRRSHRSGKSNEEDPEGRSSNYHKASSHASKSTSLTSQRGLLRRMQRVTSDEDHLTHCSEFHSMVSGDDNNTIEVIGAGLPLMQRLKLLKQKEEREALAAPANAQHVQVHVGSPESGPFTKPPGGAVSVPLLSSTEAPHSSEPIGAGLPLLQRLKLLKQKEELEHQKKLNAATPSPSNHPPTQVIHHIGGAECAKHNTKDGVDQDSTATRHSLRPILPYHPCSDVKEETAEDIKEIEQESTPLLPQASTVKEEKRVGFRDQKHFYTNAASKAPGTSGTSIPLHDDFTSTNSNSSLTDNGALRGGKWRRRLSHKGRDALMRAKTRARWSFSSSKTNLQEELPQQSKTNGGPSEPLFQLSHLPRRKGASSSDLRVPRCNSEGGIFREYRRQQTVPVVTDVESVLTDVFNHVLSPASPLAALALSPTNASPPSNPDVRTITIRSSCDGRATLQETSFSNESKPSQVVSPDAASSGRPRRLRLDQSSRNYVSVDDLSPEFTVLPFVKRLKILNERQKLAELERQLKSARSFSLDSTDLNPTPGENTNVLVRSQSNSGALETAAFALNDNHTHQEDKAPESHEENEPAARHYSPPTSPESNETPERRSLKYFLRQLSQGDTPPAWLKGPQHKRQLLRSQTVEGYAARHAQFTSGGRYTSYKETLPSPPLPQPQHLPQIADASEEEEKLGSSISTSAKLCELPPQTTVVPEKNSSGSSPPFSSPKLKKSNSPRCKGNKEIAIGRKEECVTDLLMGIKQVLQTRLEDIQNRFQDRIEFLETEVQRRELTIQQLREQLRLLTQPHNRMTSPPSGRSLIEDISAEEADAESEASSSDSDENPSHFFMRNHSRDSIIYHSRSVEDDKPTNEDVGIVTDSIAWDEFSEDEYHEAQRLPSPSLLPNAITPVSTSTSPLSPQDHDEALLELEFGSAWTRLRSDTVIHVESSQSSGEYDDFGPYSEAYPVSKNRKPSLKKRLQKAFSSDFAGLNRQRKQLRVCKSLSPSSENQHEPPTPSRHLLRSILEARPGPNPSAPQTYRPGKFLSRVHNSGSVP